jgi:hypothetical protein
MSQPVYRANTIKFVEHTTPIELFPAHVQEVFDRLENIGATQGEDGPSRSNVEWAKKVLLRVIPRYFLSGAEIDAFRREIHVNWEKGNKRVVAFLPEPNQLKIYSERVKDDGEVEHHLQKDVADPWVLSGTLRWLFKD